MIIAKHDVQKILVDNESSIDILFYDAFIRMNLSDNQLRRVSTPLVGFSRDIIRVKEKLLLLLLEHPTKHYLAFTIVRLPSTYNTEG